MASYTAQSSSVVEQTKHLQAALTRKDEQLMSCNERLSELESLQKFAQDTTLKADYEQDNLRKELKQAKLAKESAVKEAEDSKQQVNKLELRISELSLAEQCAKTEVDELW